MIELDPARQLERRQRTGPRRGEPQYLGKHTGVLVTQETVRVYLPAHDYVCKCPTWTDANARPKRKLTMWEMRGSVEVLLAGATTPEPLPVYDAR